jgi:predicted ATP-grasp superfamily ATP-dependent carboligase
MIPVLEMDRQPRELRMRAHVPEPVRDEDDLHRSGRAGLSIPLSAPPSSADLVARAGSFDHSSYAMSLDQTHDRDVKALIVESGFTRGALAGCRALRRGGWLVGIGSPTRRGLAASSRYRDRWHEVPAVEEDLDAFLVATERAVREGGYEVVFCTEDAQVLGLSYGRDGISAKIPYPSHDIVVRAFDKLELFRAARRVGMSAPHTTAADDEAIANVPLPVLVKARLHWTPRARPAPARLEAAICHDLTDVRRRALEIRQHGGDPLVQEVIRGRLVHLLVVVDEAGNVIAGVQTLAEPLFYPGPDVGQRIRSVSVPVDEKLQGRTAALMKELKWQGMASLNLLRPEDDGEPALIDFNGRYGASFDQYIAAGSNFPAIWACMATGRPLPPIRPIRVGIRFQWLEGDLRRAWRQRRGGLLRDVMDCISYSRGAVHTLWRRDDPMPTVRFAQRFVKELAGRARRRIVAKRERATTSTASLGSADEGP